jgi:hypothetical protein
MDVQYAGTRVPTAMMMAMMRFVGARTTYTTSLPSSIAIDDDSWTRDARSSA